MKHSKNSDLIIRAIDVLGGVVTNEQLEAYLSDLIPAEPLMSLRRFNIGKSAAEALKQRYSLDLIAAQRLLLEQLLLVRALPEADSERQQLMPWAARLNLPVSASPEELLHWLLAHPTAPPVFMAQRIQAQLSPPDRRLKSMVSRNLQKLFHHQYILRKRLDSDQPGKDPFLNGLDDKGLEYLTEKLNVSSGAVSRFPRDTRRLMDSYFMQHEQLVGDFLVVIHRLANQGKLEIVSAVPGVLLQRWEKLEKNRDKQLVPYVVRQDGKKWRKRPDLAVIVRLPDKQKPLVIFHETENRGATRRFREKVVAYYNYLRRGEFKNNWSYDDFVVLTSCRSSQRLKNCLTVTENALKKSCEITDTDHHFWFCLQPEVDIWQPEKLLGPVWTIATQQTVEASLV
jgi:hypothetical protein